MANFPLRLDDTTYDQLKAAADSDGRSMNAEVVTAIEDYLHRRRLTRLTNEAAALNDQQRDALDDFDATCEALRA